MLYATAALLCAAAVLSFASSCAIDALDHGVGLGENRFR